MWNLIADLVHSYSIDGNMDQAMDCLTQALISHPQWIPNAMFDDRTKLVRGHPQFEQATQLPHEDGPAHFNAAVVAFEFGEINHAVEWLTLTFDLANEDGSLPYLLEALRDDDALRPYLAHSRVASLVEQYDT